MVQILPHNPKPVRETQYRTPKTTQAQKFLQAVAPGIESFLTAVFKGQEEKKQKQQEEDKYEKLYEGLERLTGQDFRGVADTGLIKELVGQQASQLKSGKQGEIAQEKEQRARDQASIVAKSMRGEDLTPEEEERLSPQQQIALGKEKRAATKGPSGAYSTQPVPESYRNKIEQVLTNNPESKADTLKKEMDAAGIPPAYSNTYIENRRREDERRAETEQRGEAQKTKHALHRDNELLTTVNELRQSLPLEEAALDGMHDAITGGNQSSQSLNVLAEKTGLEWFRDAAGGQFKTAGKTFLINNVSKFGARPNQYIEQQMADALPKVGRSRSANMISWQALNFDSDIKKEMVKITDDLDEKGNYKPGSLGRERDKRMKAFVEKRQKELAEKVRFIKDNENEIDETPQGTIPMIDPKGRLVYVPEDLVTDAMLQGAIHL